MISVCITNLGKYNEGELASQWLELPASSTQIEAALDSIGIDNCMYEEYFFADWESENPANGCFKKSAEPGFEVKVSV